ncbi:uncharacterized protein LOC142586919 [Dermacentor variabilis]|uniref:uncharacterized protein LOC142586919 n=1 Tax=Dermacentor variabilis TaxID=34621 RepID=UPI003F5C98C6
MSQFEVPPMETAQDFLFGLLKLIEEDLQQPPPTHRDAVYQLLEPFGPVSFEGDLDSVLVPSLYLNDPYLYPRGVPMYYNYGTLGTQLGTAMAHVDAVLYMQNARRTFFSRSCLLWCSSDSAAGPLTARERCMVPLHNMRDFADTFGCSGRQDFVQGECEA